MGHHNKSVKIKKQRTTTTKNRNNRHYSLFIHKNAFLSMTFLWLVLLQYLLATHYQIDFHPIDNLSICSFLIEILPFVCFTRGMKGIFYSNASHSYCTKNLVKFNSTMPACCIDVGP